MVEEARQAQLQMLWQSPEPMVDLTESSDDDEGSVELVPFPPPTKTQRATVDIQAGPPTASKSGHTPTKAATAVKHTMVSRVLPIDIINVGRAARNSKTNGRSKI